MPLVILALLVLLALAVLISLSWSVIGFLVMLAVAGVIGAIADAIIPGHLPFGWLGAIIAGLLGSWLGVMLFGRIGPDLAGIPIISALFGAFILAFVFNLLAKLTARRRATY